jgi:hypothetical protein
MNTVNVSSHNAYSNFVFKFIALELMGHKLFEEFHLNRHVSDIKCDQRLVATVSQILIVPHYL